MTARRRNTTAAKYTRAIANHFARLERSLSTLSLDDLRAIEADIDAITESNSWYIAHRYRDAMRQLIGETMIERYAAEQRARDYLDLKS